MPAPIARPAPLQLRVWMIVAAAALVLGMLASFHQVVLKAVQQAALRHQANALVMQAIWQCNSTPTPVASTCAAKPKAGYVWVGDLEMLGAPHRPAGEIQ